MAIPYEGTQIGSDGLRYPTGEQPVGAPTGRMIVIAEGTPALGDVVWYDPETGKPTWSDMDTVAAYVPSS